MNDKTENKITEVDLIEFLDADSAPVAFHVDGIKGDLFCKVLSLQELGTILREGSGDSIEFSAKLLASTVVDQAGNPRVPIEKWRAIKTSQKDIYHLLVRNVQKINGMLTPEEAAELGKPSASTDA